MMRACIPLMCLLMLAADWPQFLGPDRNSSTKEIIAPWKDTPKELWKVPVGAAHSSPIVEKGLVYAFYQDPSKTKGNDRQVLAAFDAVTGEKKWEQGYEREAYTPPFGKGPRGTPCVKDGVICTYDNAGILTARDSASGRELWQENVLKTYGVDNLMFGVSTSPIIVDGNVIVMAGSKKAGIAAWNLTQGKVAWTATADPASYSSPILDHGNLVFLTGSHLRALTPKGEPVWEFAFKDRLNESSTMPVAMGDQILGSSVTAGSILLKVKDNKPEKVWAEKTLTCYFSTPVVLGERIYMINGAATLTNPSVTLRCVNAKDGSVLWERPKVGRYHAALVSTGDGKILMLDDDGYLSLFSDDPKQYSELCRSKVCGITWAHPAIVDGKLYLRDEKFLYCFAVR